jgi:transcriptional regulator with XRE-family HTH domain
MPRKTTKNQEVLLPNSIVSERIKSARMSKNYTMEYIAHRLGISEKAYQNIEYNANKSITIERLQQIANVLEINWLELLKSDDKITQVNGGEITGNNNMNIYQSDQALAHSLEKSEQENAFLKEKNALLEDKIKNLERINALLEGNEQIKK